MKSELKRVLIKKGFEEKIAEECSKLFTETSCDGIYSHGLNRFPRLVEYIDKGFIHKNAMPSKIEGMGSFERWNGNLGLGNVNAKICMARAIELAKEFGMGCVALRNTNHWMRGGTYGWQAANEGFIGICFTNTLPNMPAWGGKDPKIGNNPLILAVPRAEGNVVVDLAMSQFSYGKIETYKRNNELLPVPGGYDLQGNISRDPSKIEESNRILPMGYWKGSGLSLLLDLIATILSGGNSTYKIGELAGEEYNISQVFIAFNAKEIAGEQFINTAVNEIIQNIKSSEKINENGEIFYPAERELKTRKDNLENGIPVDEIIWNKVKGF